jgi:hypothetical protein
VTSISIPPVEFAHRGTGSHAVTKLVVDPETVVPGAAPLSFVSRPLRMRTFLYQIEAEVTPDWIGIAVADGISDFSRPILYFHPSPAGAGYVDGPNNAVYFGKKKPAGVRTPQESKWLELFAYVDRLGGQLAGAVTFGGSPDQVVVVPLMPSSALGTTGILPDLWRPILSDILADVRATVTGVVGPVDITDVVVAGYSFGCSVAQTFRTRAKTVELRPLMKEVWDFDGSPANVASAIHSVAGQYVAVKFSEGARPGALALPKPRWALYPDPPPDEDPLLPLRADIHHLIRDFMFLPATLQRGSNSP